MKNIDKLFDKLGAQLVVNLKAHHVHDTKHLIMKRAAVELMYEGLDRGDRSLQTPEWTKGVDGRDKPAKVAVVWDRHTPWSAGHRQFLRRAFLGAGVHEDETSHLWAWPYGSQFPALDTQLAMMRATLIAALDAANARYVLTLGAQVLNLWRKELILKQVEGRFAVWNGQWIIYPMKNPIAVLREPMLQGEWREMIYRFGNAVYDGVELDDMPTNCTEAKCIGGVYMYDPDGVGWCKEHAPKAMKRRLDGRDTVAKRGNIELQEELF